jgi:hypothetical protein
MFGSTIEFVLRSYSCEYEPIATPILPDGSMHSFGKQAHISNSDISSIFTTELKKNAITTIIYPTRQGMLPGILVELNQHADITDSFILMYASNLAEAELNMLFQYHKIANGSKLKLGLEIFCGANTHNIKNWNGNYTHWSDMQPWQLREWLSLFYVDWVKQWQQSPNQTSTQFLKITNGQLLENPSQVFARIIKHCGLTPRAGLDLFALTWRQAQQYVIDEYALLDQIVDHAINNEQLRWSSTNIIAEAIVQQKLRALGYEIQCDGLDVFPTDSKTLYTMLYKV